MCIAIENNADHNLIIKMRITGLVFESKTIKLNEAIGMNITNKRRSMKNDEIPYEPP